jgi:hydrogenase expression/formation protein HypD
MKHLDEYRDRRLIDGQYRSIQGTASRKWNIMEVCGGQTHAILRHGIDQRLSEAVTLLHGPGCPVCVTPAETIDQAIALAALPDVVLCTFGDMLRVPGSSMDLQSARAGGADVRMVYSPAEALSLAISNPALHVVFFAIGFETTAPATASAVLEAQHHGLPNFSILSAHVRIPPAMAHLLNSSPLHIDAFLAPGHVCTITGIREYEQLCRDHNVPVVITGFEPVDILYGIRLAVEQLEQGDVRVQNAYSRAVRPDGNPGALHCIDKVFESVDRCWRGLGHIPASGLAVRERYAKCDTTTRFALAPGPSHDTDECICGEILRGSKQPTDCPAFAGRCTPESPLGPTMVSSEGACAAYYRYVHNRPATTS